MQRETRRRKMWKTNIIDLTNERTCAGASGEACFNRLHSLFAAIQIKKRIKTHWHLRPHLSPATVAVGVSPTERLMRALAPGMWHADKAKRFPPLIKFTCDLRRDLCAEQGK